MAYRPRFTVPFKRDDELDDNFVPEPYLSSRRTVPNSSGQRFRYQDPNAEKGATDYRSEIDKLYGTGEAMEKFYSHVQNVPRQEDYAPGVMGRITAALAGTSAGWQQGAGAGIGTAQKVLRRPYEQAVEEYEMKGQGLKAAADIEQARDAKRVAYLKELREFDKDAYDRTIKEMDAESRRITALAREKTAENQAELARLTELRDQATDERERKKISNQIIKVQNDLKLGQEANDIRRQGVAATRERTGAYERVGMDRNSKVGQGKTSERVISPQADIAAEVGAAGTLLNKPEYQWLRDQGIVTLGKDFIEVAGKKKVSGGWFGKDQHPVTPEDQKVLDKFLEDVEKEKKKRLNQTIKLGSKKEDDIIDLDLDDDEDFR